MGGGGGESGKPPSLLQTIPGKKIGGAFHPKSGTADNIDATPSMALSPASLGPVAEQRDGCSAIVQDKPSVKSTV